MLRKLLNLSLITLLIFILFGCHDENGDNPVLNERQLKVIVQYKDGVRIHTDANAKVFIYYGVYSMDLAGFNYTSDGVLTGRDKTLYPDIVMNMNGKEDMTLTLDCTKIVTILVESGFFAKKIILESYSPNNDPIKLTCIFG